MALAAALLSGCVTVSRESFSAAERFNAAPAGFPLVRFHPEDDVALAAIHAHLPRRSRPPQPGTVLAVSGGGANGAFGAGVLVGWTETGTRPSFSVVTGVSTGALIALYAFLGPAWDAELQKAYTDGRSSKLLSVRGVPILTKGSVYSGEPLRRLAEASVSDAMLAAIGAEHDLGRELIVGTADLDSQAMVLWDMGAIASHGGPAARALFIQVLVASASIPGIFPPAMIDTEAGGRRIREMHVDGGMINAFVGLPEKALMTRGAVPPGGSIYILVNGKVDVEFAAATKPGMLSVLSRTYDTMSKASWRNSLLQVATYGDDNGITTRVAMVPAMVPANPLDFTTQSMIDRFQMGRSRARSGTAWSDLKQRLVKP